MMRPERGCCEQCRTPVKGYGKLRVFDGRWLCSDCYNSMEASLKRVHSTYQIQKWRIRNKRWNP